MDKSALCVSTEVLPGNKIEIQTPDLSVGEIVEVIIITTNIPKKQKNNEPDPLIGLFKGSPDLATKSEDILHQEIQDNSGLTWKEN
ncbi:MAG: hypothetical protein AAGF26_01170 [Cyanobacteria bacterium P01_G01_bin.49]